MIDPSQTDHGKSNIAFSSWSEILDQLLLGQALTVGQARSAMDEVLAGRTTPAQLSAFMVALRAKGESVFELTGLAQALLGAAVPVPASATVEHSRLIDTCGTGGDKSGTINVSTMAALVAAAGGAAVAKHGNRAASSQTGSADVLEALGVAIDLPPEAVVRCIEETGFGFFLAPRFHPGFRHVAPIRRELGVRTAFNFLGPLINPARVERQVIGVSDPSVASLMMGVLQANGTKRAMVLFGNDGLDELTTTTTSTIFELKDGQILEYQLDPRDYDLAPATNDDLRGGAPAENAERVRKILGGERHPQSDIVALNAAAAFLISDLVDSMAEGVTKAQAVLASGAGSEVLQKLIAVSTS